MGKLVKLVLWLVLSVSSSSFAAQDKQPQLVITFATSQTDPESQDFIDNLSDFSGVPIVYVSPLEAPRQHLFGIARRVSKANFDRIIKAIERRDDVVSVESALFADPHWDEE